MGHRNESAVLRMGAAARGQHPRPLRRFAPALPKGEPMAALGQQVLNLSDALPLPLGEVAARQR